jgi:N utilization substance protein A
MRPQKKNSKRQQATKKSRTSRKKKTAPRKNRIKATSREKLVKASSKQRKTSARSRTRPKRGSVHPASDIEREIRNKRLNTADAASRESDFLGLSRTVEADSESVDELVEEGNVFEAGAVKGVEEADSEDEREVHTHEVPEDDVPDEYLEKE